MFKPLPNDFNKKKSIVSFGATNNPNLLEIQNLGRLQCLGKNPWPEIKKLNGWMISAETAAFMKWGGLGMVASELPETFNKTFAPDNDRLTVVTGMYIGDTGKKKAYLEADTYYGAEKIAVKVKKLKSIVVPFIGASGHLVKHHVDVLLGQCGNVDYIFIWNETYFSINPHPDNISSQDGCYVLNEFDINEVERFAFFSKAVYLLIKELLNSAKPVITPPNILLANDWHSAAIAGLVKYGSPAQVDAGIITSELADKLKNIPVVHIAHHLGYQGWDYPNTAKILNSLYEDLSSLVFKNARAIKNSNKRTQNTLIVHDCYNQASCHFHLADRVVTVSKNYMDEVSKELDFGFDFRDILKIRKDHRNFFGIVNGYDKKLISPNATRIAKISNYFAPFSFSVYDEDNFDAKLKNKEEFIKLISHIAADDSFKQKVIPLIDIHEFQDIGKSIKKIKNTPVVCMTSRLVEQKGYDIAAQAIINVLAKLEIHKGAELPVFVMGGAGDKDYFAKILASLKDKVALVNPKAAERIFVFRGYQDDFAYAIQLAADFYLMPSKFEPCGLTQMEAMAKGTLPIAMSTGGLVDTIEHGVDGFRTSAFFSPKNRRVYGGNLAAQRLKNNINAYTETLSEALATFYRHPDTICRMTKNAMKKDFSWDVKNGSIYKYHQLLKTGHI